MEEYWRLFEWQKYSIDAFKRGKLEDKQISSDNYLSTLNKAERKKIIEGKFHFESSIIVQRTCTFLTIQLLEWLDSVFFFKFEAIALTRRIGL